MFRRGGPILLAALTFGAAASAQTGPAEVARRDLLRDADAARDAGDHARALELATRAAQIRMTTSLRLLLAQEQEATGHLVEALDHASGCVREAEADTTLHNRERLQRICGALVASITPRIGNVVVQVPSPPPGLVVRVAGHEVNAALYGVPLPVMPGRVVVEVGGEGIEPSREEVQVAAGARAEVRPRVQRHEERAARTPLRTAVDPRVVSVAPAERRGPGVGPWVLVGLGAASAVAGGVLLAVASAYHSDSGNLCPALTCRSDADIQTARGLDDSYVTFWNSGIAALSAGGAVVAVGLLWYAVAPRGERSRSVSWSVAPTALGVSLSVGGDL